MVRVFYLQYFIDSEPPAECSTKPFALHSGKSRIWALPMSLLLNDSSHPILNYTELLSNSIRYTLNFHISLFSLMPCFVHEMSPFDSLTPWTAFILIQMSLKWQLQFFSIHTQHNESPFSFVISVSCICHTHCLNRGNLPIRDIRFGLHKIIN